ncbi:MAG: HNH endonuclease [Ignavibacteria bacterium]|nr:HNH endonuclease [Ignavibacteria bacterium]
MASIAVERLGQHAKADDSTAVKADYYLSSAWRTKRQQRLAHDDNTCQGCGITAQQLEQLGWPPLQVHHKNAGPPDYRYPSFGNEALSDLLTLCPTCHDGITNSVRKQRFQLDPHKQVNPTLIEPSPLSVSPPQRLARPSNPHLSALGPEPIALPQRADRRSTQLLRQGHEGRQQQTEEN